MPLAPGPFAEADPRAVAEALWQASAQPVDTVRAAETLIGLSRAAARLTAAVVLTTSPEVDTLVDALPRMVRALTVATNVRTERLFGEIRGPVVWNETLAARAATAGDPGLFVCASLKRAYDTAENRVLVSCLQSVVHAGQLVERAGLRERNSGLARHVRHNADMALRYLDHPALAGVHPAAVRRDIARARAGKHRGTYAPALAVLRRATQPIGPEHVAALSSARARAQHAALVAVIDALAARGTPVSSMRSFDHGFGGGPVLYVHDDSAHRAGRPGGIHVGNVLLDVPVAADGTVQPGDTALAALAQRAPGRQCAIVADPSDVAWALDQAATADTGAGREPRRLGRARALLLVELLVLALRVETPRGVLVVGRRAALGTGLSFDLDRPLEGARLFKAPMATLLHVPAP